MIRLVPLLALLAGVTPAAAEAVRAEITAFGRSGWIEVAGRPAAEAEGAIRQAVLRLRWVERELDAGPAGEGTAAGLNAAAGAGPRGIEPEMLDLLVRALNFCVWLDGLHGPLGARLYGLWEESRRERARPARDLLEAAVASAACNRMIVDPRAGTVELAEGSRLELAGFDLGFAIDQAVSALREAGVESGRVAVGEVQRAFGPVHGAPGWPTPLPRFPGMREALGSLRLKDRALAVVRRDDAAPLLDQRTGMPVDGPLAVLAVTELAVDAQALATAMFIAGSRDGQMRLGVLNPPPSVLWLLGDGTGEPVFTSHRWTQVTR